MHGHEIIAFNFLSLSSRTLSHHQRVTGTRGMMTMATGAVYLAKYYLMPAAKWVAAAAGLAARCWWSGQGDDQKRRYREKVAENRGAVVGGAALAVGLCSATLWLHVDRDPITGELVLCVYNDRVLAAISKAKVDKAFGAGAPRPWQRPDDTERWHGPWIIERVVAANAHMPAIRNRQWLLYTDDSFEAVAHSVPYGPCAGLVYVSAGMVNMINNDQLALVVSHEMAHLALRHTNRRWTVQALVDGAHVAIVAAAWTLLPAITALAVSVAGSYALAWLFTMPHSRRMELEADRVGFMMAARACVDVAQGPKMWTYWADRERSPPTWWRSIVSVHPKNRSRADQLNQLMDEARRQQLLAKCWAD